MRHDKPSRTMQRPALLRAAHQILDDDPKIHLDPVAVGLTSESSVESVRAQESLLRSWECVLLRSGFVLRARYAEDCLAEAVHAGASQYVILGAGLDTFAYRQPAYASALRIFEVDHPASQASKRTCLAAKTIQPPENLSFVAVNFERERLEDKLADHGFDTTVPSFFSWLGVVQYLTAPAIEATLGFVASLAPGTAVTFSFYLPDELLAGEDLELTRQLATIGADKGEPWLSRYRPEDLRVIATRLGFSSTHHLTPETANRRYFQGRNDGLRAPRSVQLFTAKV